MKKISVKKIKEQLDAVDATQADVIVVSGLVEHHNDLVRDYNAGDKCQQYLLYQLKQQIWKAVQDLKKQQARIAPRNEPENDDGF